MFLAERVWFSFPGMRLVDARVTLSVQVCVRVGAMASSSSKDGCPRPALQSASTWESHLNLSTYQLPQHLKDKAVEHDRKPLFTCAKVLRTHEIAERRLEKKEGKQLASIAKRAKRASKPDVPTTVIECKGFGPEPVSRSGPLVYRHMGGKFEAFKSRGAHNSMEYEMLLYPSDDEPWDEEEDETLDDSESDGSGCFASEAEAIAARKVLAASRAAQAQVAARAAQPLVVAKAAVAQVAVRAAQGVSEEGRWKRDDWKQGWSGGGWVGDCGWQHTVWKDTCGWEHSGWQASWGEGVWSEDTS